MVDFFKRAIIIGMILLIIFLFFKLVSSDSISNDGLVKTDGNPKPDYLTVYNLYKNTNYIKVCEEFGEEMKKKPYEKNWQLYPYKIEDDMEILNSTKLEDGWEFEIACSIRASYQANAVTHFYDEFEKRLGTIKYTRN